MLIVIHQISEIAVLGLINLGTNSKPKRVTLWFWSSFGIYSKSIKSIIASWLNHMENKLSGTSGSAAELVAHVAQEGWEGLSDTSWLVTQCLLRSEMKSRQGVGAEVC